MVLRLLEVEIAVSGGLWEIRDDGVVRLFSGGGKDWNNERYCPRFASVEQCRK